MKFFSIVCFAGGDWWYHHPHSYNHLMAEFSKEKKVLYVNSLPVGIGVGGGKKGFFRKVKNKLFSVLRFLKKENKNLYIFTPFFIPFKENSIILNINTILLLFQIKLIEKIFKFEDPLYWITNPNGYIFVRGIKSKRIVYQIVDKVQEYKYAGSLVRNFDKNLCERASLILTPGKMIYEEKRKDYGEKVYRLKHGVDIKHFSKKVDTIPKDFPKVDKPVFTYWGSIDYKKVDYKLLKFLDEKAKEFVFLFIGKIFDFKYEDFKDSKNIFFVGEKSYSQLPSYATFSYGFIIPWDSEDLMNRHASPIKLREYLATGKPVVSTYIPEFDEFKDVVYISKDYGEFYDNLKRSLLDDDSKKKERKNKIFKDGWENVYKEVNSIIGNI